MPLDIIWYHGVRNCYRLVRSFVPMDLFYFYSSVRYVTTRELLCEYVACSLISNEKD